MSEQLEKVAQDLKNLRKEKGLNQRKLAELFNSTEPLDLRVNWRDVSKYERGIVTMPVDKYLKFMSL